MKLRDLMIDSWFIICEDYRSNQMPDSTRSGVMLIQKIKPDIHGNNVMHENCLSPWKLPGDTDVQRIMIPSQLCIISKEGKR